MAYETILSDFFHFLSAAPTCYHVIDVLRRGLLAAGFAPLQEGSLWGLEPERRYFVTRGDSSLIAFTLPRADFTGFQLVAAHSDSPAFKLKENYELEAAGGYIKLNVEKYGGMILSTWLDRPLGIAGRVILQEGNRFLPRLFDAGRDLAIIPNVAIHFDRTANESKSFNPQVDLLPALGGEKGDLEKLIAATLDVQPEQIVSRDLFLYNRMPPARWGIKGEYIAGPRLDDLQCAYASFRAFLQARNTVSVPVFAVFDNEDVGSGTKQGAAGTFLKDTLERIHTALGHSHEDYLRSLASSFMVSADNAHAVHPNHAEKSDQVNRPQLNGGVVIKHNANQKYTTDAVSAAVFKAICREAGVPVQEFHNRSDLAGGSTLGNLSNLQVSLNTVDIGLPQLAMHSAYECAGAADSAWLATALEAFYSGSIQPDSGGGLIWEKGDR